MYKMRKIDLVLIVLVLISLVGCSSRKSKGPTAEVANKSSVSGVEVVSDPLGPPIEEIFPDAKIVKEEKIVQKIEKEVAVEKKSDDYEYEVKNNETLMIVAFKLFGDYEKWRYLQEKNNIALNTKLVPGTILKYEKQGNDFKWTPKGSPYLIQIGETLGTISNKLYNTISKWRVLWENNRPLIKNPNLIFAGFTIYYMPLNKLANK